MLTYDFQQVDGPLYLFIYNCLKQDITSGKLQAGEKLPSKRAFARNNGISTITVQNAYDQLVSEGYIYTQPKRGYFVADIVKVQAPVVDVAVSYKIHVAEKPAEGIYDLSDNSMDPANFPFSVWTKVSREIMSNRKEDLMTISPSGGVRELREAIANYLKSFRGMLVDPDQIIIGAGTEYLYGIITELLGKEKIYAIENPGYKKLVNIYKQRDIQCRFASLDDKGITVDELKRVKAEVAHICPTHHFPTGITMPASRRYELLAWANASRDRYILEDDYDSEFRSGGRPLPTLFSIDGCEKVIYVNTFSKSLSPTIRISYMILPVHLANRYYEKLSFYACTVSNFEQYTLAEFIQQGYFEKHINRMRLFYMRRRKNIIENIKGSAIGEKCRIIENDAGLHFLLQVEADLNMQNLKELLLKNGIKVRSLDEYYLADNSLDSLDKQNLYIINYSRLNDTMIKEVLDICQHIFHYLLDGTDCR